MVVMKQGRPKKKPANVRTKRIGFSATHSEWQELRVAAEQEGLGLSGYIRARVFASELGQASGKSRRKK